ncbi:DUF58 domain-containing protein [Porphyromonas gingivalis]|uniref:DUF58 domain-containing protein n=1 Tax=Porphyromonas gingivalis TaxID=837 RepID=A0AAE9X9S3_PORGN|nr:DUF58 domain-containing protein [Porphyromonas gingivalis]WCG02714.1 DUF58 domain-containing protein [Porphyromonas gingivalis]
MQTSDLLKKVRRIEIKARGLSRQIFAGQYHSAFRGRGMAFSEVREYTVGDDVRDIDWNVTARYARPYVKVFEEERELTVMLMVDMSGSLSFGTEVETKRELTAEVAATLAFSAIQNNDKIGVLFFTDRIEKYVPPAKGKKHILYIIRELLEFRPQSRATDLSVPLSYLTRLVKKRCTAFLISDFQSEEDSYEKTLLMSARKHDIVAIRIFDRREADLPNVGLMRFRDAETGQTHWVDTTDSSVRKAYADAYERRQVALAVLLKRCGVDTTEIRTGQDFVQQLLILFKKRS